MIVKIWWQTEEITAFQKDMSACKLNCFPYSIKIESKYMQSHGVWMQVGLSLLSAIGFDHPMIQLDQLDSSGFSWIKTSNESLDHGLSRGLWTIAIFIVFHFENDCILKHSIFKCFSVWLSWQPVLVIYMRANNSSFELLKISPSKDIRACRCRPTSY